VGSSRGRAAQPTALAAKDVTGEDFPWGALRYRNTVALQAMLTALTRRRTILDDTGRVASKPWSASYASAHVIALRQVLREAWRLNLLTSEEYRQASEIKPIKAVRRPAGSALRPDEVAAVLDAVVATQTPKGVRDAALLALAYTSGGRRAELVGATLSDWNSRERTLWLLGKGGKERVNPIPVWAVRYLDAWLALRGREAGPLFVRVFSPAESRTRAPPSPCTRRPCRTSSPTRAASLPSPGTRRTTCAARSSRTWPTSPTCSRRRLWPGTATRPPPRSTTGAGFARPALPSTACPIRTTSPSLRRAEPTDHPLETPQEFITGALRENPRRVGKPLGPPLQGVWSARRGPYRVLYEIDEDNKVVVVLHVGHRRDVYRSR
jgi:integrase/mRNA-degrading endonuclease RelE of RelBE toxin-antitoxin system